MLNNGLFFVVKLDTHLDRKDVYNVFRALFQVPVEQKGKSVEGFIPVRERVSLLHWPSVEHVGISIIVAALIP